MKVLVQVLTVVSLAVCLAAALFRFFEVVSYASYTTILLVASLVYFVAAGSWAEMRR